MELMADKRGVGFKLDPRTKMALLVTFSVFILGGMDGKLPLALSVVLKAMPPFLLLSVRQWKKTAAYVVLYTVFALVQEFFIPSFSGLPGYVLLMLCGIFLRFYPGIMVGAYVVSTTTVSEFIAAMRKLYISEAVVIPMSVMFRFFPTVGEEFHAINNAMKMRGIRAGGIHVAKMLEYCMVPLMTCSVRIGEELSAAALTRGLHSGAKRTNICHIGFHAADILLLALCAGCYVSLLWALR